MKQIAAMTAEFTQERIAQIEQAVETELEIDGERIKVTTADFEITSDDMPGWLVATEGKLTVALDITVTDELRAEGVARELINRIQNIRKDADFAVTDKIRGRNRVERIGCLGFGALCGLHRIADARRRSQRRGGTCGCGRDGFGHRWRTAPDRRYTCVSPNSP